MNGSNLGRFLREVEIPYVILDMNPERVWAARAAGEPIRYGDANHREILEHLGRARAWWWRSPTPPRPDVR